MTETDERFGPQYVRPQQKDCPDCGCCTAALCERGKNSFLECRGHTPQELQETVLGCPCSAATTRHTAAWRLAHVRATRMACEKPLPEESETLLRALADGESVDDDPLLFPELTVRGLAAFIDDRPDVTELGRTYLAARDEERVTAAVHVVDVDRTQRTALVEVEEWQPGEPVTVLLDQVLSETGLDKADALQDRWLTAEANTSVADADALVLTGFRVTDSQDTQDAEHGELQAEGAR
ncbi:hypothetical protein [Streptomyces sp. BH104]|uniref:hypothetical protein n=1 Tax=Streptomyces sp. BH104 TaxID=3410407 RepID=UPI003BB68DDF